MSTAPEATPTADPTISSPPAKRVKTDESSTTMAAAVEQIPALQVKKLSPAGRLPTRGSAFAAGYDLYAARDTTVPARGKVLVDTDISIAVPGGTCTFAAPLPCGSPPQLDAWIALGLGGLNTNSLGMNRRPYRSPIWPRRQALHRHWRGRH